MLVCRQAHASLQVPITTLELTVREYQAEIRNALGGAAIEMPGLLEVWKMFLLRVCLHVCVCASFCAALFV